jgi:hypothetical protein
MEGITEGKKCEEFSAMYVEGDIYCNIQVEGITPLIQ